MVITPLQKISFLVLRLMSSLIFITAGLNHLFRTADATARLEKAPLGYLATWVAPAETLIILSGIGLLLGGLLLLAGFKTQLAALLLVGIMIPITMTIQVVRAEGTGPLFNNIALTGVLIFFMVNGAMYYGLDQVRQLRKHSLCWLPTSTAGIWPYWLEPDAAAWFLYNYSTRCSGGYHANLSKSAAKICSAHQPP